MIGFSRPSVQTELDRFYKSLSRSTDFETISKSAFTQARKKLKYTAFIELNKSQLDYFDRHAPHKKTWKGKRLVAIDGSLLNLPHTEEVESYFGGVSNQHEKVVSARCSFAFDVTNELVLDAKIAPRRSCEKDLAVKHLESLNPKTDLLIFDRGYPSQWLIGLLMKKGFEFCFRLSTAWKGAYQVLESANDIAWSMTRRSKKDLGKLRTYNIPSTLTGLRLVSIPLISGEKEVLVTNLTDTNSFPINSLKELYNKRWGVEEGYKTFKKVIHIEHFSGKSVLAIKQDFHARVFMLNMASMVRNQGVNSESKNKNNTYKSKINKTQTLAKIKDFLVDLFYSKRIRKIVKHLVEVIKARKDIDRPDRSFRRMPSSSRRRAKIINYKGF